MVELLVSLLVLLVAISGAMGSISSFVVLGDSARETTLAYLGAQRMLEALQQEQFGQVFARYNTDPTDDPPGAPGAGFAVDGLSAQETDPDGFVGRVLFPVSPAEPGALRENLVDEDFGMPRDLTADGVEDADDHSGDYAILPVRVRIEWRGTSGNRFVELQTSLIER